MKKNLHVDHNDCHQNVVKTKNNPIKKKRKRATTKMMQPAYCPKHLSKSKDRPGMTQHTQTQKIDLLS
jgi:hypothetical protein